MSVDSLHELWYDRDLGWLEFNRRVLAEAQDERVPLLERLKFLAIFTSNLDEFFMKRMAVHHAAVDAAAGTQSTEDARRLLFPRGAEQHVCFISLTPRLQKHGVRLLHWADLTERQRLEASLFFTENVSPALTPQVVDPAHPFPFLSNLSLSWACQLREPGSDTRLYGRVKVASGLPPWIPVRAETPAGCRWFISLTELIRRHLAELFAGLDAIGHTLFRITRDAEVEWYDGHSNESLR